MCNTETTAERGIIPLYWSQSFTSYVRVLYRERHGTETSPSSRFFTVFPRTGSLFFIQDEATRRCCRYRPPKDGWVGNRVQTTTKGEKRLNVFRSLGLWLAARTTPSRRVTKRMRDFAAFPETNMSNRDKQGGKAERLPLTESLIGCTNDPFTKSNRTCESFRRIS